MTYTHLTTTEPVMIEAYYKEGVTVRPVSDICQSLKRSRQTIYKVIAHLKAGHTAIITTRTTKLTINVVVVVRLNSPKMNMIWH